MRTCSTEGCGRRAHAKGLCVTHYNRHRAQSTPTCAIEGCNSNAWSKGLCSLHYQRARAGGDMMAPPMVKNPQGDFCTADGCIRPPKARGLCDAHWFRDVGRSAATGPVRPMPLHRNRKDRDESLVEDVADLLEFGTSAPEIARRVADGRYGPASLAQKLKRLGHPELAQPFWSAA